MNQSLDTEDDIHSLNIDKKRKTNCTLPATAPLSNRSKLKKELKRKRNQRKKLAEAKKELKQKNEEPRPKKPVSKPLMDTLWAKFKLRKEPTLQDCYSLSFEFSMTDKQVYQWFQEKKKKYKEEMLKEVERAAKLSMVQTCCADTR